MDSPTLYGFTCNEDPYHEHKEFTLTSTSVSEIPFDDVMRYLNGEYDDKLFNIILENIRLYVKKYIPKYIASFINTYNYTNKKTNRKMNPVEQAQLNVQEYGYLNFGITDDGYISGIPILFFEKNKDMIHQLIRDEIKKFVDELAIVYSNTYTNRKTHKRYKYNRGEKVNLQHIGSLCGRIKIDLTPLTIPEPETIEESNPVRLIINNSKEQIAAYEIMREKQLQEQESYEIKFNEWYAKMLLYGCKLLHVLDDPQVRYEFIDYVMEHHPESYILINDMNVMEDTIDIYVVITDYKNRKLIIFHDKYDYIIKQFRDFMRKLLISNKPQKPRRTSKYDSNIFPQMYSSMRVTPLIEKFSYNKDITYVLITVRIPLIKLPTHIHMSYKENGKYITRKRVNCFVQGKVSPQSLNI